MPAPPPERPPPLPAPTLCGFYGAAVTLAAAVVTIAATAAPPPPLPTPSPPPAPTAAPAPEPEPTPVPPAIIFRIRPSLNIDTETAGGALGRAADRLACAVTGQATPRQAWLALVATAEGTVVVQGPRVPLHISGGLDAAAAIVSRCQAACGRSRRVQLWRGVRARADLDPEAALELPMVGKLIWGDLLFSPKGDEVSSRSHWARAISGGHGPLINVAPLRADESCGVAGTIYNVTVPNLDNWRRLIGPPGHGDPALCDAFTAPQLAGRMPIHFLDGITAQFAGGPEPSPNYQVEHGYLYASRDPVALDTLAFGLVEQWRKAAQLPSLAPRTTYLPTAATLGLGRTEPAEIRDLQ